MDLKHQLIMEMVITGFCNDFHNTMLDNGISYTESWEEEDFDTWFNGGNKLI